MSVSPRYPLFVDLSGRACLVVGGGSVAARKVRGLLDSAATVTVVAPILGDDLATSVERGDVAWRRTAVSGASVEADLFGPGTDGAWWLVVAATDDAELNRAVVAAGARRGVWVNDVTDAQGGPASVGAVHRTGPVTVAVSTGGVSPSAAAWLRDELAQTLDPTAVEALELLAEVVAEVREDITADVVADVVVEGSTEARSSPRGASVGEVSGHEEGKTGRPDWRTVLDSGMLDDIREGRRAKAKERLKACLSSSSD